MSPDASAAHPVKLGRYQILCPLGTGGMGAIWLARMSGAHGFEKLVAVKTIRGDFAGDDRLRTMFLDEVRLLNRIEHPNVAQVLDVGEEPEGPFVVLEWVDGDSLAVLNHAVREKGGFIPHGIALRIAADALSGLHAAHQLHDAHGTLLQVVHRDVSPQNILIHVSGGVKVIDFGIAKARDRATAETGDALLKGKIHYMSPEQAAGHPVDLRADIFGMGAVLYELLAGRAPYAASNQTATVFRLVTGDPPPIELPSSIPQQISEIVSRAIARDRNERFVSAAEMIDAIERAVATMDERADSLAVAEYVALNLSDRIESRRTLVADATRLDPRAGANASSTGGVSLSPSPRPGGKLVRWGAAIGLSGLAAVILTLSLRGNRSTAHASAAAPAGTNANLDAEADRAPATVIAATQTAASISSSGFAPSVPAITPARLQNARVESSSSKGLGPRHTLPPAPQGSAPHHKDYGI